MLRATDTADPEYYHRVVDCQWACPAHTNVPEYIRLVARGDYVGSYLLNRQSNVFPGILGRVCDRPCEPACRRGRVEAEPVAICRLKRVAADRKGEIRSLLPKAPLQKNGRRIALVGGGPAALTVANDLLPIGYEVELFDKSPKLGGAMRSQVPAFRLPETVLDEEISYITEMGGLTVRTGAGIDRLSDLLRPESRFDAVVVGTGAPVGRDLDLPGRRDGAAGVRIGVEWLASVSFGHVKSVAESVIVVGGGNTAMDCCRTALRLGAKKVTVVAPERYEEMLASSWEKADAEAEGISIRNGLLPQEYLLDQDRSTLVGMRFRPLRSLFTNGTWDPIPSGEPDLEVQAGEVILAIGQTRAFPFIDPASGVGLDANGRSPLLSEHTLQSATEPRVFFVGDCALGPKNIIEAVAQGHKVAISVDLFCRGLPIDERPSAIMGLVSQKMGLHEWAYDSGFSSQKREHVPHLDLRARLEKLSREVELGFDEQQAAREAARCLNCDVQTVFAENLCIECDACLDICPMDCLAIAAPQASEEEQRLAMPVPATRKDQPFFVSGALKTSRVMLKDEDLCLHCGLCAERCPTGAWDMKKMIRAGGTLVQPRQEGPRA